MSFPQLVYIFDKNSGLEYWGTMTTTIDLFGGKGRERGLITKGELRTLHKHPIGFILSEFISLDEMELVNMALSFNNNEDDDLCFSPYRMIEPLPLILFCEDDTTTFLGNGVRAELLYIANSIAVLRSFIDISNDNRMMFSDVWFQAFLSVSDGVDDYLEPYEMISGPLGDIHAWERRTNTTSLREWNKDKVDYEEPNPNKNAENLLGFLQNEVGNYDCYTDETLIVYKYRNPISYLFCSLEHLIKEDILPKKCQNCGKYFIPEKRSDTVYCNRQAPKDSTKTCKEYGARQAWKKTLRENEAAGLYRNIYMAKQMLVKRNPNIVEYKQSFEKYKSESKQWKINVKTGARTESEYIEWLRAVKEKKVL